MLYRSTQLPLIERARACNSRWNNFAVFADEIFKNFNIFIIYLFDSLRGKAAKLFALKQRTIGFLISFFIFAVFASRETSCELILLRLLRKPFSFTEVPTLNSATVKASCPRTITSSSKNTFRGISASNCLDAWLIVNSITAVPPGV